MRITAERRGKARIGVADSERRVRAGGLQAGWVERGVDLTVLCIVCIVVPGRVIERITREDGEIAISLLYKEARNGIYPSGAQIF